LFFIDDLDNFEISSYIKCKINDKKKYDIDEKTFKAMLDLFMKSYPMTEEIKQNIHDNKKSII
jgi:hypothetical protein